MRNREPISWTKVAVEREGGCGICNRSELAPDKMGLIYPYEWVWALDLGPMRLRACAECLPGLAAVVLDAEADANPERPGAYEMHEAIEEAAIVATTSKHPAKRREAALELMNLATAVSEMVKRAS